MISIKFPKKISENEIKRFFVSEGLKDFVPKKKYIVDGYEVTKKDFEKKKKDKKNKFDIRKTSNPQPPELQDLYRLYQFILLNKRTTVLEFGCGYSSILISKALKKLRLKNKKKLPFARCKYPFQLFIIDNVKKYLNIVKKRLKKYLVYENVNFFYSKAQMTIYKDNFATEYLELPRVNPDFIYLDGPNPFTINNSKNNFTVSNPDMMPMSCDILKFENYLTPGTIILIDGRAANARFLKNNFKRNWKEFFEKEHDQTIFLLDEKPLGPFNIEQIKFYKKT